MKIAVNGFGRIGRNVVRALFDSGRNKDIELVAINDLGDCEMNAQLFKYDSVHDRFDGDVKAEGDHLIIKGQKIKVFSARDPRDIPWGELGVDVVMESTGMFTSKIKAHTHIDAGAKKVLISAPAGKDIPTIVYGVNDDTLKASDTIVSNASCTTNCLAPVVWPLHEAMNITAGLMTTIHAITSDQKLVDAYHQDIRRARSAMLSMIPTKTGAAAAVGLVLPELNGKLDGYAIRVPVANVSVVDLTFEAEKDLSIGEINDIMFKAARDRMKGVLGYNEEPLVSIDFNHCAKSSTFDATQTRKVGKLYKVISWYDNEWGFSNRMLDTANAMMDAR